MKMFFAVIHCFALCLFIGVQTGHASPVNQSASVDASAMPADDSAALARVERLLWFHCTVDHQEWPSHSEVAVSNTGLVVVLFSDSLTTGLLVPYRQQPSEIRRLFGIVDRAANNAGPIQPPAKDEKKRNACRLMYGPPNAMGGTLSVYAYNVERMEPLTSAIRHLVDLAEIAANPEPADGPPATLKIETDDFEFLPHFFATMHANEVMATGEIQE